MKDRINIEGRDGAFAVYRAAKHFAGSHRCSFCKNCSV
jgi:hypothetical protein